VNISVQDNEGNSTTIMSMADVVANVITIPASFSFTGGLALNANNGNHVLMGYTNTNRPTFSGTAVPFATVQLFGKFWGADAVQPLGEAVTNASGQWSLMVGPLTSGTYTITATVTPPGSYPIAENLTTNLDNGLVYIDMVPPTVKVRKRKVAEAPAVHRVTVKHEVGQHHRVLTTRANKHHG
jgi:hypothetical protein